MQTAADRPDAGVESRYAGRRKSPLVTALHLAGLLLPGDYLKTAVYLNLVARPRKALRLALNGFYRFDHVYDVLREARRRYRGSFSILEFGTSAGYAFTKMLYATKYLGMDDRVVVHGFDTFEGLAAPADERDQGLVAPDIWLEGDYRASYQELDEYCRRRYANYRLHRGDFAATLTPELLGSLRADLPILVWIDCDYYTSARIVFERLLGHLPTGCVVYFDDYDLNFGSRFTGEARLVHEINQGLFGDGFELVLDTDLSWNSRRVYRFASYQSDIRYEPLAPRRETTARRPRSNASPLP